MNSNFKILYPIIDGQVTGGNIICLYLIEEAINRGWTVIVNSPNDGPFCDILRAKGVSIYNLDTSHSYYWNVAVEMANLIKKQDISLIHSHTPFAGSILTCIAGKIAGVPVINHAHVCNYINNNFVIRLYQKLMSWCISKTCCDAIISVSNQVKKEAILEGCDRKKIHVVYNGTPLKSLNNIQSVSVQESIRKQLDIPNNVPVVVHVGRLCETKGQHLLIKAASHLRQHGLEIIYLIVGEDLVQNGKYFQYLKELTKEFKVSDLVWFLGQRSDIFQLLVTADLLVLPSSAEGLPLVILEAMAAGKPVVATNVGGVAEIVEHQKTGLLISVGDVSGLAEAILWMVQNPESARKMGDKGLEIVQENFSVEKMQREIFNVYNRILDLKT
jgi:glycosyltransferase involved in cell wall biosynthesis